MTIGRDLVPSANLRAYHAVETYINLSENAVTTDIRSRQFVWSRITIDTGITIRIVSVMMSRVP